MGSRVTTLSEADVGQAARQRTFREGGRGAPAASGLRVHQEHRGVLPFNWSCARGIITNRRGLSMAAIRLYVGVVTQCKR